jgi:PQQ-dependent catabolism-associated CXXCW motif protein
MPSERLLVACIAAAGLLRELIFAGAAVAQVRIPRVQPANVSFASEDRDWGVRYTNAFRDSVYHAPTPAVFPLGRIIRTLDLKALIDSNKSVIVIDVVGGETRQTVPGAYSIPGAGTAELGDDDYMYFILALELLTNGNKRRPLVFLCVSSECWLSYRAAHQAFFMGYRDVIWYRGGTEAWRAASLEMRPPLPVVK